MLVTNPRGVQEAYRNWPNSPRGSLEAVVSVSPLAKREMRGRRARDPRVKLSLGWKETETTVTQAHHQSLSGSLFSRHMASLRCAKKPRDLATRLVRAGPRFYPLPTLDIVNILSRLYPRSTLRLTLFLSSSGLIQMMASAACSRDLVYFTFGDVVSFSDFHISFLFVSFLFLDTVVN